MIEINRTTWIEKALFALAALCAIAVLGAALKQKQAAGGEERVYVLEMHWIKPGSSLEDVNAYMREVGPILARHGAHTIEEFSVMQPDILGGLSFPSEADLHALLSDPDFQRLAQMREETFDMERGLLLRIERIDLSAAMVSAAGKSSFRESGAR